MCLKRPVAEPCVFRHTSFFNLTRFRLSPAVSIAWELEYIQKVVAYAYFLKCFPSTVSKFLDLHYGLCFIQGWFLYGVRDKDVASWFYVWIPIFSEPLAVEAPFSLPNTVGICVKNQLTKPACLYLSALFYFIGLDVCRARIMLALLRFCIITWNQEWW